MEADVNESHNRAHIAILLRDAQPTASDRAADARGTEERRIAAIAGLRALYLTPPVPVSVRHFFDALWDHILKQSDPVATMSQLFNGKPRRGPKPNSDERNLSIAVSVQHYINEGLTLEEACRQAQHGSEIGSWERIREIYYGPETDGDPEARDRWRRRTLAAIALRDEAFPAPSPIDDHSG